MAAASDPSVVAVRFGTMETSREHEFHRYGVYGEPPAPLTIDYFFWVIWAGEDTILVDTGFHPDALASRPGRTCLIPPVDALRSIGVDPDTVGHVVVSHFHYDHIGNLAAFPNARFVVQRRELEFWTGPHARRPVLAATVEAGEIEFVAEAARRGRVDLVDGDAAVTEQVRVRLTAGHTPGQQVVEVDGPTPLTLCSDALHLYEELDRGMPWNVFSSLDGMFDTYALLDRSRAAGRTVVAGHDPLVRTRFAPLPGHEELGTLLAGPA